MKIPDTATKNKILRANLLLHQRDAAVYDLRHVYTTDKWFAQQIQNDIKKIGQHVSSKSPVYLDLGAGTGFLAEKFLNSNFKVVAVDISENMLKILKQKLEDKKIAVVAEEIGDFLSHTPRQLFHVIGFSSTLHHLPDYLATLQKCCDLLPQNGILYIINEPVTSRGHSKFSIICDKLDETLDGFYFKLFHDTADLGRSAIRRMMISIKKLIARINSNKRFHKLIESFRIQEMVDRIQFRFQKDTGAEFIDDTLAEYHADPGIDLDAVMQIFEDNNVEILEKSFYSTRKIRILRWSGRFYPGCRHLRIIAKKTSE
jgi:2-polyprenyl-3-methyl-5-hydroxy-6-metoxy-1,4-benzoquinol methylase